MSWVSEIPTTQASEVMRIANITDPQAKGQALKEQAEAQQQKLMDVFSNKDTTAKAPPNPDRLTVSELAQNIDQVSQVYAGWGLEPNNTFSVKA